MSGLSQIIVCGLGLVLLAVLADVLYRLNDPGVRLLCLLGVLGVIGWLSWKKLFLPLRTGLGDLDLALRIERIHPGMRDAALEWCAVHDRQGRSASWFPGFAAGGRRAGCQADRDDRS